MKIEPSAVPAPAPLRPRSLVGAISLILALLACPLPLEVSLFLGSSVNPPAALFALPAVAATLLGGSDLYLKTRKLPVAAILALLSTLALAGNLWLQYLDNATCTFTSGGLERAYLWAALIAWLLALAVLAAGWRTAGASKAPLAVLGLALAPPALYALVFLYSIGAGGAC